MKQTTRSKHRSSTSSNSTISVNFRFRQRVKPFPPPPRHPSRSTGVSTRESDAAISRASTLRAERASRVSIRNGHVEWFRVMEGRCRRIGCGRRNGKTRERVWEEVGGGEKHEKCIALWYTRTMHNDRRLHVCTHGSIKVECPATPDHSWRSTVGGRSKRRAIEREEESRALRGRRHLAASCFLLAFFPRDSVE